MTKILILQGPNLNLLGHKSSILGERLTLSKLNKAIRSKTNHHDVELKFLQTHKSFQAVNFLQRNRNKANGLLLTKVKLKMLLNMSIKSIIKH